MGCGASSEVDRALAKPINVKDLKVKDEPAKDGQKDEAEAKMEQIQKALLDQNDDEVSKSSTPALGASAAAEKDKGKDEEEENDDAAAEADESDDNKDPIMKTFNQMLPGLRSKKAKDDAQQKKTPADTDVDELLDDFVEGD